MKRILTIVMLLTSSSVHAALNKWIDADGKVHYSDSAPADAKVKQIRSSSATEAAPESALPGSEAPAQKTIAEREADWKKSQLSKAEDEKKAANKKEEASIKQKKL